MRLILNFEARFLQIDSSRRLGGHSHFSAGPRLVSISVSQVKLMESFILKGVTTTGKELGRGAYGTVFEVMYCGTNYAAKEIHSMCNGEPGVMVKELKDEFLRECCLRSKCLHPNIVQFIGMYHPMANNVNPQVTDQLIPSMVMEFMDCSLRKLIKQNTVYVPLHSVLSIYIT